MNLINNENTINGCLIDSKILVNYDTYVGFHKKEFEINFINFLSFNWVKTIKIEPTSIKIYQNYLFLNMKVIID